MAAVLYRQPWSLHQDLFNEVNRLFNRAGANDTASSTPAAWSPSVDIDEHADKFVLHVDVPGVDAASIEVTLDKGVLSLTGTREPAAEKAGVERRLCERATGRFHRRFTLPDTVDADAVSATGRNGVLEVVIPKRAQVQPRRIAVNATASG
ncbi:MAG: Hsp20/alpha crystallin family protein [Panacagrimonas sp.]